MGKFDGILICTDLDGTLYKNDKTVSRENREAIEYFKENGGYFTFITGRMPNYSQDAYNAARPNVPFGCVNGGGVYDGVKKEYIWTAAMPEGALDLVRYIDESFSDLGIQICTFNRTYFARENGTMQNFRRETGLPNLVCPYWEVDEPIAKVIFGTDCEEDILRIEAMLRAHPLSGKFGFIRSQKNLFEILPGGVHKGLALTRLAEYLNVDVSKTVAIGDYNNDIGMFKAAGVGVAVSNSCRAALEVADYVTVSNEEHAVARVIYDIENGKYGI